MSNGQETIIVIGDIMLDEYIFGDVNRVSPESCCPILLETHRSYQLGGAANVAKQLVELGSNVRLVGVIGTDNAGEKVTNLLHKAHIDCSGVFVHNIVTTCKSRYINNLHQQMFRADNECLGSLVVDEMEMLTNLISHDETECVVVSDYNKGVISTAVCKAIISCAKKYNKKVIVDIKEPSIEKYHGATIVKGNKREVLGLLGSHHQTQDVKSVLPKIREKLNTSLLIMTCGGEGIIAIDKENNIYELPAEERHVFDVTGAGDIVTAFCSFLISDGYNIRQALYYANKAANIKVERFGNSSVSLDEVLGLHNKTITPKQLKERIKGKKMVFTNGCFDVIHAGHIDMLQKAKSKGDVLVVAINSDDSVHRIKGNERPINSLEERVNVLSAIGCVDYIIPFEEDTPRVLIEEVCPDVLVKGGDYSVDKIVGADFVKSNGGEVCTIPFVYNTSTTKLLNALK